MTLTSTSPHLRPTQSSENTVPSTSPAVASLAGSAYPLSFSADPSSAHSAANNHLRTTRPTPRTYWQHCPGADLPLSLCTRASIKRVIARASRHFPRTCVRARSLCRAACRRTPQPSSYHGWARRSFLIAVRWPRRTALCIRPLASCCSRLDGARRGRSAGPLLGVGSGCERREVAVINSDGTRLIFVIVMHRDCMQNKTIIACGCARGIFR